MITKQTPCEVCKRKYCKPLGQVGPAICTACLHTETAKAIYKAEALGQKAFAEGRTSTPALDPALNELLKGKGNGCLPILNAWTRAWHRANLDAPVIVDGVDIVKEMRGPR